MNPTDIRTWLCVDRAVVVVVHAPRRKAVLIVSSRASSPGHLILIALLQRSPQSNVTIMWIFSESLSQRILKKFAGFSLKRQMKSLRSKRCPSPTTSAIAYGPWWTARCLHTRSSTLPNPSLLYHSLRTRTDWAFNKLPQPLLGSCSGWDPSHVTWRLSASRGSSRTLLSARTGARQEPSRSKTWDIWVTWHMVSEH